MLSGFCMVHIQRSTRNQLLPVKGLRCPRKVLLVRSRNPAATGWALPNKWDRIIGNIRAGASGLPSFAQDLQVLTSTRASVAASRWSAACSYMFEAAVASSRMLPAQAGWRPSCTELLCG
jgi:hypothetical protein